MKAATGSAGSPGAKVWFWSAISGIACLYFFGLAASTVVPYGPPRSIASVVRQVVTADGLGHEVAWPRHFLGATAGLMAAAFFACAHRRSIRRLAAIVCLLLPLAATAGGMKGSFQWVLMIPYAPFFTAGAILGLGDGEFYAEGWLSFAALGWWMILWTVLLVRDRRGPAGREPSMQPATWLRRTIIMLAAVGLHAAPSAAAPLAGGVARLENPEPAFSWFDTLGYPDIRGARFGRIATGNWTHWPGHPPRNLYWHGFLLAEDDEWFRVFVLDSLETQSFKKTPRNTEVHRRIEFQERDLATYVNERIAADYRPKLDPYGRPLDDFYGCVPKRAATFAVAWAASRRGLRGPASRLFEYVARMPDDARSARHATVRLKVVEDLAYAEMWRAVDLSGHSHITRDFLADRFRRIATLFPESSHCARAAQTAEMFDRMFREDQEHVAPEFGRAFEEPSLQEQIAEGIFRLRDQNGRQYMLPGRCDVFHSDEGKEDSPGHELVRMGYDTVPQLIDALDDQRPTRTVECDDFGRFTHRMVTVGRCAEEVIVRIAGRRFDLPDANSPRSASDPLADKKKLIRAWHDDILRLGERRVWSAGVERGDVDSREQADRLIARYPAHASGPIVAGAMRATDLEIRAGLVERLADLRGPEILPLLLEEAGSSDNRSAYLSSAMVLHHRGRPEGLAELQRRWRRAVDNPVEPEPVLADAPQLNGHERLASLLIWSNRTAAVRLVSETMHRFPIDVRLEIVEASDKDALLYERFPVPNAVQPDPDYDTELLALLMTALDDDQERAFGRNGYRNGKRYDDSRVCDLAGQVLSRRDPQRYPFVAKTDMLSRDRARYAILDAWRMENDLPPRAEKKPRPPTQVAAD